MSNERVVLCGGLAAPAGVAKKAMVPLYLWGKHQNVTLKISDISQKMAANIPPVLVDLLEIATYVYCADQATTRGAGNAKNYGAKWRRRFRFHIPVRKPDLWSSNPVVTALRDTLGFLSDDEYEFTFKKLTDPPSVEQYLDFGPGGATGFRPDEVILFSGGLDSLGGAVQEATVGKRAIALVSHRSSPKIAKRQKELLEDLGKHCSKKPFHVPVWINKEKALGREFTQRTRSFLYASLAAVVARIFDLWRIRFGVRSPWFESRSEIQTYTPEELLATKLRALYQRRKGRDLFDLWTGLRLKGVDPGKVVQAFRRYLAAEGTWLTRDAFGQNLAAKVKFRAFGDDLRPLLAAGTGYDADEAAKLVREKLLARL